MLSRSLVLSLSCLKPTSLCKLSSLSNAVVITERKPNTMRIRIDTCAHDATPDGQGHHRNVCVWTSRLSGAHYRPETVTVPEICRLLLVKLWLRSNHTSLFLPMYEITYQSWWCKGQHTARHARGLRFDSRVRTPLSLYHCCIYVVFTFV